MAEQVEQQAIEEVPANQSRLKPGHKIAMMGVAGGALVAMMVFHGHKTDRTKGQGDAPAIMQGMTPFEPVQPAVLQVPVQPPPKGPPSRAHVRAEAGPAVKQDDWLQKLRDAPLDSSQGKPQQVSAQITAGSVSPTGSTGRETDLGVKLHPTILEGSKAAILPHPDMTITEGTLIPCILDTALDSDAPGMVVCTTQQATYGSTGTVDLLPRGSKIVGEYGHDMTQGVSRQFVLWTRAETPDHVVISLNSPGADALGRSGFDGWIDAHFWQRMGGALMFTLIDSAGSAISSLANRSGNNLNLNLGSASSAADTVLQNTINIRPTIHINQGTVEGIMVARDLDFSGVYSLEMR